MHGGDNTTQPTGQWVKNCRERLERCLGKREVKMLEGGKEVAA